jgi:serine/threonine-protein kinase RsbW
LNLKIQSKTEKLILVREFISEAARKFGFDNESVNKITLAVDEACTNIIKHAYEFSPSQEIDLKVKMNDGEFVVVITDKGKSFDPQQIKVPNMREYLSHYQKGGLGMHLMRSLVDKVEYKIYPAKKNEVRLVKYL